jgi:hypothetical protein
MPMTKESQATSNKLFLPLDGLWKGKEKLTPLGYVDEGACSQFLSTLGTGEDAALVSHDETVEVVLQKLEVTIKERDEVQEQLDSLQGTLGMGGYKTTF